MLGRIYRDNPYGWLVVAVSFVVLTFIFSARSSLGLMMPFWEADLGWSRSFVSFGGAIVLTVMAISSTLGGYALDRFGPRIVYSLGLLLAGGAIFLSAFMDAKWQLIVLFGLIGGLGFGSTAVPQISATIARIFDKHRGLATGAAASGATGGQLLVIPVLGYLATTLDWRTSYILFGLAMLAFAPICWVVLSRRRRETMPSPGAATARRDPDAQGPEASAPLREKLAYLRGNRTFWLLFLGFVICGFTTTGVVEVHLIPYAAACGYPPLDSATAYGVLSGFSMVGIILFGMLSDRMNRPRLLAAVYLLRGLSFIVLMFIAHDISLLFIFAVLFGLFNYSTMPMVASITASHIGLKIAGLTLGIMFAGHSVGAAAGAFMAGILFDLFATYNATWVVAIALATLAAILSWMIPETRKPKDAVAAPALAQAA